MVTEGKNRDRVGTNKNREEQKDSFKTIHVQDATRHEVPTRLSNMYTFGKGTIILPSHGFLVTRSISHCSLHNTKHPANQRNHISVASHISIHGDEIIIGYIIRRSKVITKTHPDSHRSIY
ncbi:hypothetical protein Dsin_001646 [Dipteronia sinensis]|uniref:Uncharacterized protein n=1 Tax=Dipteronia sinensis TaxID=43782 RepID=A0AAE0EKH4_9ROSI|nr:hypothetical protein Dsin_001646 [Dipteronia sinensis]